MVVEGGIRGDEGLVLGGWEDVVVMEKKGGWYFSYFFRCSDDFKQFNIFPNPTCLCQSSIEFELNKKIF